MAPRCARFAWAALFSSGPRLCWGSLAEEPSCQTPPSTGAKAGHATPGLVLMQERFVASIESVGRQESNTTRACAPFREWPHVDGGITCVGCTALVHTAPFNRCDKYCESFGHICVAAAEEVGDSCAMKHKASCNQKFSGTSDMLCTCHLPARLPVRTPVQLPPVCGSDRGCKHCPSDEKPMHAGCFIVKEGKLLAHRITYGGRRFDLPGGQSNWREPARCTAHRETFEETGYEVSPKELLAGGLHGGWFNLYRCELLRDAPTKGPDHEVSGVWWLTADEVAEKVRRGQWRFPEASRYVEWMR